MQLCLGTQSFQKCMTKLPPRRAEFYTKSTKSRIQIHTANKGKEILDTKEKGGPEKAEGTKIFVSNLQK